MYRIFLFMAVLFMLPACNEPGTPGPRAYPRIALPEKSYQLFDSVYPYRMEYPIYASFAPDERDTAEPYWADIVFPEFSGRIHLSYKEIHKEEELMEYHEDARTFVHRHIPKATAIDQERMVHVENDVYGMLYKIRGREAASPLQFFATDSVDHFLRGALYFDVAPNNDSLAPVIHFIEEDIRHFFSTLEWE